MMLKVMNNKKGFSLIELMVTVGIIGILAMIAIPSYNGFQARARQKEGFNLLNAYYTAAQATHTEFGYYPGNFVQSGFAPDGELTYRLRAEDGRDITSFGRNDNACFRTQAACDCTASGGNCPQFKTWREKPPGGVGVNIGPVGVEPSACGAWGATSVSDDAFVAKVAGVINPRSANVDRYAIRETKEILMCNDGLK